MSRLAFEAMERYSAEGVPLLHIPVTAADRAADLAALLATQPPTPQAPLFAAPPARTTYGV